MKVRKIVKSRLMWVGLLFAAVILTPFAGQAAPPPQEAITATPVQINLSTAVPAQLQPPGSGPTPTRTPTQGAPIVLEARELANVRSEPSTDSAQLGTIRAGERYNVIGRYFQWLQFEFPSSPNGRGWVFGELVNIIGDAAAIPELDLSAQPTVDPLAGNATATANAITLTPGGVLTLTAAVRQLATPAGGQSSEMAIPAPGQDGTRAILPTFTYPPGIDSAAPTPTTGFDAVFADDTTPQLAPPSPVLPPIVPILALGGLGLLGVAISSLRR